MRTEKESMLLDTEDLTHDLRNIKDAGWNALRKLLKREGLDYNDLLLVAFSENEAGFETGLLVSKSNCYEYEMEQENCNNVTKWLVGRDNLDLFSDSQEYVEWGQEHFDDFEKLK
jgi:hypothetical protein